MPRAVTLNPRQPTVLLASSRSDGNTAALVRAVLPAGQAAVVDLSALRIGPYSYTQAHAGDDFLPLIERIVPAPLWVLATPLYWYTMSAQAKTFIDRLSDLLTIRQDLGRRLRGKGLAVVCAGNDPLPPPSFCEPLQLTCRYLGMRFLGLHYAPLADGVPAEAFATEAAAAFGRFLTAAAADGAVPEDTPRGSH